MRTRRSAARQHGPLLSLKGVTKTYWLGSTPVRALRGISLSVNEGEFVAVMGPSGSGKSTLMHLIGLLDAPDRGSYLLDGAETRNLGEDERAALRSRAIGFVFQQFNLLPRLNAYENIALPLLYASGTPPVRPAELSKAFSLSNRLRHRPSELSGGQQQRVAIARSLVNSPRLILADEPTGNLDSATQREIMGLLTRLNQRGLTIMLVTHEPDVAKYARRIIWMRDGVIVSDRRNGAEPRRREARHEPAGQPAVQAEPPPREPAPLASRLPALLEPLALQAGAHFKEARRSLLTNKARSSLSTLGIMIGVGAVIAMLALGEGARTNMAQSFSRYGTNMLSVNSNWYPVRGRSGGNAITRMTAEDAMILPRAHYAIKRTAPVHWVWGRATVTFAGKDWNPRGLIGSVPDYADMRNYRPTIGRFFTARENQERARVVLVGRTVARELFGEDGNPVGALVRLNKIPFTVIGVLPEKGANPWWDSDDLVIVPLGTSQYRLTGDRYISSIDVEVAQDADVDEVSDAIKGFLKRRYHLKGGSKEDEPFSVRNEALFRQAMGEMVQTMSMLLGIIAGISLLVGGIGIMNIMLVTVTERTREIGLRKAVGARPKDILTQFLVEAATISLSGGVLGILLGSVISLLLAWIANWAVTVTPFSVILAFGFSAAVGIGFGFWPARRAARLHPAEALRYE